VLVVAISTTILRQQQASERELLESTERLGRQLVRLRQAQWLQQQALARALHGPVQAAVTSSALRLDAAVRAGEAHDALLEDTRRSLLATIDVLDITETPNHSLELAFERIAGTWEGVCRVTWHVDACADERLLRDPIAAAVIIDIMTEAVSNAVRHGGSQHAEISIACGDDDLVSLVVRDDGLGDVQSSIPGLGTVLLEECTLEWNRDVSDDGCVLTVTVPTDSPKAKQHAGGQHRAW
jgi:two-component sensor histidine kinase